jgi:PAS domain-containing protein
MTETQQNKPEVARIGEPLNSKSKKELNELVGFIADVLKMPIAVISLMQYEKQFIKDSIDTDLKPDSREVSFCRHLTAQDDMKIIPDARFDKYLESNFVARGNPSVLFYAGVPLITGDGRRLGSLCLFDRKPRYLSVKQKKMLMTMARQMVRLLEAEMNLKIINRQEMELKKRQEELIASEGKLRAFFKSSAFCHMLIGKDLEVVDFNRAMATFIKEMHGQTVQIGKCVLDYINDHHKAEFRICLTRAFAGKKINKEILIKFEHKEPAWWNIILEPLKDDQGKVTGVVYNANYINDQKQRIFEITEKNKLLSSIAHVQSHEYRRPVASILGLMEVMRMENQPFTEELKMMDESVKELDQMIRSVINLTQILSSSGQLK